MAKSLCNQQKLFIKLIVVVVGYMPMKIWAWNSEVTLPFIHSTSKHSEFKTNTVRQVVYHLLFDTWLNLGNLIFDI